MSRDPRFQKDQKEFAKKLFKKIKEENPQMNKSEIIQEIRTYFIFYTDRNILRLLN